MKDVYRTATELYSSSLRALEQRASAFLTTQSLLVAAFAVLFISFYSNINLSLFVSIIGICLIGFIISLTFYFYHQVTSKDAAFWRAYSRFLEDNFPEENKGINGQNPWQTFYKYAKNKEPKYLGSRGDAAEKLPAPMLWLLSPAIFLIAWLCASVWIIEIFRSRSSGLSPCI
ncbi:hypothetical protein ACFLV5_01420 [Chloroflexota bacterium]